ncbi:unnamed protein product [Amoebophrya sp. A25]|nr:unnamed protein product [Amoebophrya sp. A25]|eukprot:GSA25T00007294001.1
MFCDYGSSQKSAFFLLVGALRRLTSSSTDTETFSSSWPLLRLLTLRARGMERLVECAGPRRPCDDQDHGASIRHGHGKKSTRKPRRTRNKKNHIAGGFFGFFRRQAKRLQDYKTKSAHHSSRYYSASRRVAHCFNGSSNDPYQILGVSRSATEDEIRRAYKKLAVKHHPDKGGDSETFKNIQSAYETLSDPSKKRQYDAYGSMGGGMGGGGPGGSGSGPFQQSSGDPFGGSTGDPFGGFANGNFQGNFGDDPFEAFSRMGFSEFAEQGRSGATRRVAKPRPLVQGISVTLEQICQRQEVEATYRRQRVCTSCKGQGGVFRVCDGCGGSGYQVRTRQFGGGYVQTQGTCGNCRGAGKIRVNQCTSCGGAGTFIAEEEVSLRLDPTVEDGYSFKFPDCGSEVPDPYSPEGVARGDLTLIVNLQAPAGRTSDGVQTTPGSSASSKSSSSSSPSSSSSSSCSTPASTKRLRYERLEFERGPQNALYTKVSVPFGDAVCGETELDLKHPCGKWIRLKLPPSLQHTDVVRVAGKGVFWDGVDDTRGRRNDKTTSSRTGDLFVKLKVLIQQGGGGSSSMSSSSTPTSRIRGPFRDAAEREALRRILNREETLSDVIEREIRERQQNNASSTTSASSTQKHPTEPQEDSQGSSWTNWFRNATASSSSGKTSSTSSSDDSTNASSVQANDVSQVLPAEKGTMNRHLKTYRADREKRKRQELSDSGHHFGPGDGGEQSCHVQ